MTEQTQGVPIPDDATDARDLLHNLSVGYLGLRRYYVAATLALDGSEAIAALSEHFGTIGRAMQELDRIRQTYPKAGILSAVLAFDPDSPADMERYKSFLAAMDDERGRLS